MNIFGRILLSIMLLNLAAIICANIKGEETTSLLIGFGLTTIGFIIVGGEYD